MRQRLGIALMILFVPINVPLWQMLSELAGYPLEIGEFTFFALSVILFLLGGVMTFTPQLRWPSSE